MQRTVVLFWLPVAIKAAKSCSPFRQAMLRRIRECGGRVILTSDCHDARFLDCAFSESAALLKACGFQSAWELRADGEAEVTL